MHSKVVIIGSGPAGLTAALYAARANLEPLVVRGLQPGGLIATTAEVENYPGFVDGIGGYELAESMEKQAARFGAQFKDALIDKIDASQRPFVLTTDGGEQITADTIIVSTGASPKKLGVPGEEKLANRGVSYCATCDGFFFRNKKVVVVGGGNSALDEGLFLTRYVSELIIVHRRDELRADPILQERAFSNEKVRRRAHPQPEDRRDHGGGGGRGLPLHWPHPEQLAIQGPARSRRGRLYRQRRAHAHQRAGHLRRRRRGRPHLPPGDHRRRRGLPGRYGGHLVPVRAGAHRQEGQPGRDPGSHFARAGPVVGRSRQDH
jgi:cation diffusion facilitator CzcD-associated flavoprotein CzcO